MDENTYKSLLSLLDYTEVEYDDYEESGRPEGHVYEDIVRLRDWAREVATNYPTSK